MAPRPITAYAAGKFQFTGLPPGIYRLSASRAGFLDHPARRVISLGSDDHATDAEIRLPPQGAIAGRILDEEDDPSPGAFVSIFKQVYLNGRKQWDRLNISSVANDAGEYRIPNLKPGTYLLQTRSQRPEADNRYGGRDVPDTPRMFYVPVYYRNASTQQAASPVEVGVGAEVSGIDIRLFKLARPPSVHVKGKVIGVSPDSPVTINVWLSSTEETAFGGGSDLVNGPDFAFDLTAPPGQYTIRAHVYSGGPEAFGTGSLTVTGDVAGVVLAMSPAPEVTGLISLAESGGKVNLQAVRVSLTDFSTMGVPEMRSDAAGKFVFPKPVMPGHYAIVNVRFIPDGCFVREVKLGGQEVSQDDFEISTSAQLEIVLSNTAGKIAGSVSDDDGKPFPISSVTLIPTDGKSRPAKQSVDDEGKFQFTGVRPGKYKLFAWEEVDDDLWQDPEFRKKYENRAAEITVAPNETKNAQLRVIAVEAMK